MATSIDKESPSINPEMEQQYLQEIFADIEALNEVMHEEIKKNNTPLNLNEQLDVQLTNLFEDNDCFQNKSNEILNKELHRKDLRLKLDNLQSQKSALLKYVNTK